jgi:hypothetical protein
MPSEQLRYAVWIEDKIYFVILCVCAELMLHTCTTALSLVFTLWFNIWHTSHGRGETSCEFVQTWGIPQSPMVYIFFINMTMILDDFG